MEDLVYLCRAQLCVGYVYASDGLSCSHASPLDITTDPVESDGILVWTYVGQAVFEDQPTPTTGGWTEVPDYVLTSIDYDVAEYLGVGFQTRVDGYGRKWLLTDVDIEALYDAVEEYDAETLAAFGGEPETERTGIEYPEDAGAAVYSEPFSWTVEDCDTSSSGYEVVEVDIDGLHKVTSTYNQRLRKIVLVMGPGVQCSGTMVDNYWVLTAPIVLQTATVSTIRTNLPFALMAMSKPMPSVLAVLSVKRRTTGMMVQSKTTTVC